jgi:hypothetical protein
MSRPEVKRWPMGASSIRCTGVIGDVNASNDYVDIPAPSTSDRFNLSSKSWLLFAWIYVRSLASGELTYNETIISQLDSDDGSSVASGTNAGRSIMTVSLGGSPANQITSALAGGSYMSGVVPVKNTWIGSCIFWDFDTQTLHFNIDGIAKNTHNSVNIESSTGKVRLGATKGGNRCFDGNIGPVLLLSKESGNFSDSEAAAVYYNRTIPTDATVQIAVDMLQSSGDIVTNKGNATLMNGAAWDTNTTNFPTRTVINRPQVNRPTV